MAGAAAVRLCLEGERAALREAVRPLCAHAVERTVARGRRDQAVSPRGRAPPVEDDSYWHQAASPPARMYRAL